MKTTLSPDLSPVAEKIAAVAGDLFYQHGYRATGINEVIKKAEVAKATFYHHFATKDDLFLACLQRRHKAELWFLEGAIASAKTPIDKFLAPIESRIKWLSDNNYRGCAFVHAVTEVIDEQSPQRQEGKLLYDFYENRIEQLTQEFIVNGKNKLKHLNAKEISQRYFLMFCGAITLASIYHDACPIIQAIEEIKALVVKREVAKSKIK